MYALTAIVFLIPRASILQISATYHVSDYETKGDENRLLVQGTTESPQIRKDTGKYV